MDGFIDARLVGQGLIPSGMAALLIGIGAARDGFDGLDSAVCLLAQPRNFFKADAVGLILHHQIVVGQQRRIKVKMTETLLVHAGDGDIMPGHADVFDQALFPRFLQILERAVGPHGHFPFLFADQIMQLNQVDFADPQAPQ